MSDIPREAHQVGESKLARHMSSYFHFLDAPVHRDLIVSEKVAAYYKCIF